MKLHELKTCLTEMEFQIEELQRATFTINNQLMRTQIQAEELVKRVQTISDWAHDEFDKPSGPVLAGLDQ